MISSENKYYLNVSDCKKLTSYRFYSYLLQELHKFYQSSNRMKSLVLDFYYLDKISPAVIPNIMVLGEILKNHYSKPVELSLNWQNKQFLQFLCNFDFFNIANDEDIFNFCGNIGGFDYKEYGYFQLGGHFHVNDYKWLTAKDAAPSLIENALRNDVGKDIYKFISDKSVVDTFYRSISELIANSNFWGKSRAYYSIYGGASLGLNVAISDCGIGYMDSLINSEESHVVYSKEELAGDLNCNLKSIIEAVLRHRSTKTYGVWSVINEVVCLGGKVRIHCLDTQLVFTKSSLYKNLVKSSSKEVKKYVDSLVDKYTRPTRLKMSPYRKYPVSIAGVHIEIEIPMEGQGGGNGTLERK